MLCCEPFHTHQASKKRARYISSTKLKARSNVPRCCFPNFWNYLLSKTPTYTVWQLLRANEMTTKLVSNKPTPSRLHRLVFGNVYFNHPWNILDSGRNPPITTLRHVLIFCKNKKKAKENKKKVARKILVILSTCKSSNMRAPHHSEMCMRTVLTLETNRVNF